MIAPLLISVPEKLKTLRYPKYACPLTPDTLTITASIICAGDENPLDDTMTVTFFVDFPAITESKLVGSDYNLTISKNPFSKSTFMSYQLPVQGKVSLKIYDIGGRLVKTLVNDEQQIGNHNIKLDAKGLATGVYFINLLTSCHSACPPSVWRERLPADRHGSEESITKKLVLMK